jgi:hypothetical protein
MKGYPGDLSPKNSLKLLVNISVAKKLKEKLSGTSENVPYNSKKINLVIKSIIINP